MDSPTSRIERSAQNYSIIAPISIVFGLIAVIISLLILILVLLRRQLHTVTHLLMCNTSIASIVYCVIQCNNYMYLLFVTWEKSDQSCRWRGYFGYLSMIACIYSYLLQVISRFIFIILSTKYRWLTSFKVHLYLIFIGWILIFLLPLPAILTKDISFREGFLCWVPKKAILHTIHIVLVYYTIPTALIIAIYLTIYIHIHSRGKTAAAKSRRKGKLRDYMIFRHIMMSFSVYFLGGVPYILFVFTNIELFYTVGVISVTFAVAAEKLIAIYLDREIRLLLKKLFCQRRTRIVPVRIHVATVL